MLHPDPGKRMQTCEFKRDFFDRIYNFDFDVDNSMLDLSRRSTVANASFYLNYGYQKPHEEIGHGEIGGSELWAQFSAITSFMREIESFIYSKTGQTMSLNFHQILDTLLFCLSPRVNKGIYRSY